MNSLLALLPMAGDKFKVLPIVLIAIAVFIIVVLLVVNNKKKDE